ncbi:MAG: hypothetical protein AB7G11_00370 [Phycisphaerales bacterium]
MRLGMFTCRSRVHALTRRGLLLGLSGAALLTLGGCYGSYSYSYRSYYEPCEPAHVVVRETYCDPGPAIIIDHHHGSYYGHSHDHGYRGGSRCYRRW